MAPMGAAGWARDCSSSPLWSVRARTFVPIQRAMSANNAMTEYLRNTGSELYAVPPGISEGQYLGHQLFESA